MYAFSPPQVSLAVIKFATLDPLGMGVEMDGGKPGWNDAMNGLPGLLGSGTPETFELLRLLRFLRVCMYFSREGLFIRLCRYFPKDRVRV